MFGCLPTPAAQHKNITMSLGCFCVLLLPLPTRPARYMSEWMCPWCLHLPLLVLLYLVISFLVSYPFWYITYLGNYINVK